MKNTRAARRYATALMGVAEEQHSIESVAADLDFVNRTLKGSRELQLLLVSPVVAPGRKRSVFKALFGEGTGKATIAFLDLLIAKRRETLLPLIMQEYAALRDEKNGIVNVDVVSAIELAPPQEERLRAELERFTGKKVRFRSEIDGSVRGGIRVKIGDTVLDATIRHQLERLRNRFLEGGDGASLPSHGRAG